MRSTKDYAYEKALEAIEKALDLDPMNSESHLILGTIKQYLEWDFEGAENQFKEAFGIINGQKRLLHSVFVPICIC